MMPRPRRRLRLLLGLGAAWSFAAAADQPPPFSAAGLKGWTPESMMERKSTHYDVVEDGGVKVLAAQCDDSASMEGWSGPVDLEQTPVLSWRWKVDRIYPGLDERVKDGSDFPARVYVVTGKRWLPWTLKSLIYVWSNGNYQAASWPSPYATGALGQAIIVPVRAGAAGVGEWQEQSRDVQADFKQFYNTDLKQIGAVAVMTDCDDSHGKASAWYGDLHFVAPPRPPPEMKAVPDSQ